jgi:CRP-like cAMP-binding protein
MDATHQFTTSLLIRKLESIFTLTDDERQALEILPMQIVALKENQDIVRVGDRPSRCCLILSGFTCMYKVTGDGKRQIHNFNIPGDIPDLQSLHLEVLDNSLGTITPCSVGFITHEALNKLCESHYRIARVFWRETLPGVDDQHRAARSLSAHCSLDVRDAGAPEGSGAGQRQ